ncbi:ATP-binding protein [bacterium]|nr:ATP-binding protein [bacterium]
MKQLLVISGKGGTGKTSVTAGLASLAAPVVLADCDVDAANLHLLAGDGITDRQAQAFSGGSLAQVDPAGCIGCGLCSELCRFGAIHLQPTGARQIAVVDPLGCEGCGVCIDHCPTLSISEVPRQAGELIDGRTSRGPLVWGRLEPGQPNSGKLVERVRSRAQAIAKQHQHALVIVDGPPGIGCPVIAALSGIDLALIVAEPSASSLHDLARVVELATRFRTACAVVVNKADLRESASEQIEGWCSRQGVPTLGRISYDVVFSAAACAGRSVPELAPAAPAARELAVLWERIQGQLG